MRSNQCVTQNNAGYEKTRENEGVAAYFPHVETRRDTSPHEEKSCVGGDFPPPQTILVPFHACSHFKERAYT